jgi:osmotically-inducible protein OsmY
MSEKNNQVFREVDSLTRDEKKKKIIKHKSDDDVLHAVCEKILDVHFLQLNDLVVSIEEGIVTIEGEVSNFECKKIVEEIILTTPGVKVLKNHLKLIKFS